MILKIQKTAGIFFHRFSVNSYSSLITPVKVLTKKKKTYTLNFILFQRINLVL